MNRRSLLISGLALLASPAIVRAESLMKIVPATLKIIKEYLAIDFGLGDEVAVVQSVVMENGVLKIIGIQRGQEALDAFFGKGPIPKLWLPGFALENGVSIAP